MDCSWNNQGHELLGIPPTGKQLIVKAIVIDDRVKDGKVVEHWTQRDDLGLMQQLGIIIISTQ